VFPALLHSDIEIFVDLDDLMGQILYNTET